MRRQTFALLFTIAFTSAACSQPSDDNNSSTPGENSSDAMDMKAPVGEDMPSTDEPDMGDPEPEDMKAEVEPDMRPPAPDMKPPVLLDTCVGTCTKQNLEFTALDGRTLPFSTTGFGLTHPSYTESGEWEIYIESWERGADGCPDEGSPTPDHNLILSRIPIPTTTDTLTKEADSLTSVFFDFNSDVVDTTQNPSGFIHASAVTIKPVGVSVCTECVGVLTMPDVDGFVSFDVTAEFEEGTVSGRIYAQHCDSLDSAPPQ